MDKVAYSTRFNSTWEKEHDIKSKNGHRVFSIAHIIGYPVTSFMYLLNDSPFFLTILKIELTASLSFAVVLFWHIRYNLSSQKLALYTFLLLVFFHSIVLATVPHPTYERATLNMTLALIFYTLVIRWPVRYALICTALVFICFPLSLFLLNPDALSQFLWQGGLFFFLGHAVFPFVIYERYHNNKRTFYYQYILREQNYVLEQQVLITEEATRAKTDFLSMMSHEIRTPLNGIVGIVHLLLKEELKTGFQKELIQTLLFSSNHLMSVVNDILDFNKINSNYVKLDSKPFDPALLFENLEKTFLPKTREKGLRLIFEIPNSLPAQLISDQGRLHQVITNLIHNAIKFTDSGEVKLSVSEAGRNHSSIRLLFEVSDTGIGIPLEQQPFIFELFTQADNAGSKKYGGSGLGLAITKEILRLFGSEIKLSSILNRGTSFSFEIEFAYSTKLSVEKKAPVYAFLPHSAEAKVLVVDDNSTNLLLATTYLKRKGINFETASNGEEALNKFLLADHDLILMDLRMPVMDGFESTRQIRERGFEVPIVALTASAFEDERDRALSSGFSGYLVKPFLPEDFYEMVYSHLAKKSVQIETVRNE